MIRRDEHEASLSLRAAGADVRYAELLALVEPIWYAIRCGRFRSPIISAKAMH